MVMDALRRGCGELGVLPLRFLVSIVVMAAILTEGLPAPRRIPPPTENAHQASPRVRYAWFNDNWRAGQKSVIWMDDNSGDGPVDEFVDRPRALPKEETENTHLRTPMPISHGPESSWGTSIDYDNGDFDTWPSDEPVSRNSLSYEGPSSLLNTFIFRPQVPTFSSHISPSPTLKITEKPIYSKTWKWAEDSLSYYTMTNYRTTHTRQYNSSVRQTYLAKSISSTHTYDYSWPSADQTESGVYSTYTKQVLPQLRTFEITVPDDNVDSGTAESRATHQEYHHSRKLYTSFPFDNELSEEYFAHTSEATPTTSSSYIEYNRPREVHTEHAHGILNDMTPVTTGDLISSEYERYPDTFPYRKTTFPETSGSRSSRHKSDLPTTQSSDSFVSWEIPDVTPRISLISATTVVSETTVPLPVSSLNPVDSPLSSVYVFGSFPWYLTPSVSVVKSSVKELPAYSSQINAGTLNRSYATPEEKLELATNDDTLYFLSTSTNSPSFHATKDSTEDLETRLSEVGGSLHSSVLSSFDYFSPFSTGHTEAFQHRTGSSAADFFITPDDSFSDMPVLSTVALTNGADDFYEQTSLQKHSISSADDEASVPGSAYGTRTYSGFDHAEKDLASWQKTSESFSGSSFQSDTKPTVDYDDSSLSSSLDSAPAISGPRSSPSENSGLFADRLSPSYTEPPAGSHYGEPEIILPRVTSPPSFTFVTYTDFPTIEFTLHQVLTVGSEPLSYESVTLFEPQQVKTSQVFQSSELQSENLMNVSQIILANSSQDARHSSYNGGIWPLRSSKTFDQTSGIDYTFTDEYSISPPSIPDGRQLSTISTASFRNMSSTDIMYIVSNQSVLQRPTTVSSPEEEMTKITSTTSVVFTTPILILSEAETFQRPSSAVTSPRNILETTDTEITTLSRAEDTISNFATSELSILFEDIPSATDSILQTAASFRSTVPDDHVSSLSYSESSVFKASALLYPTNNPSDSSVQLQNKSPVLLLNNSMRDASLDETASSETSSTPMMSSSETSGHLNAFSTKFHTSRIGASLSSTADLGEAVSEISSETLSAYSVHSDSTSSYQSRVLSPTVANTSPDLPPGDTLVTESTEYIKPSSTTPTVESTLEPVFHEPPDVKNWQRTVSTNTYVTPTRVLSSDSSILSARQSSLSEYESEQSITTSVNGRVGKRIDDFDLSISSTNQESEKYTSKSHTDQNKSRDIHGYLTNTSQVLTSPTSSTTDGTGALHSTSLTSSFPHSPLTALETTMNAESVSVDSKKPPTSSMSHPVLSFKPIYDETQMKTKTFHPHHTSDVLSSTATSTPSLGLTSKVHGSMMTTVRSTKITTSVQPSATSRPEDTLAYPVYSTAVFTTSTKGSESPSKHPDDSQSERKDITQTEERWPLKDKNYWILTVLESSHGNRIPENFSHTMEIRLANAYSEAFRLHRNRRDETTSRLEFIIVKILSLTNNMVQHQLEIVYIVERGGRLVPASIASAQMNKLHHERLREYLGHDVIIKAIPYEPRQTNAVLEQNTSTTPIIIGSVLGALLSILLIVLIYWRCCRPKSVQSSPRSSASGSLQRSLSIYGQHNRKQMFQETTQYISTEGGGNFPKQTTAPVSYPMKTPSAVAPARGRTLPPLPQKDKKRKTAHAGTAARQKKKTKLASKTVDETEILGATSSASSEDRHRRSRSSAEKHVSDRSTESSERSGKSSIPSLSNENKSHVYDSAQSTDGSKSVTPPSKEMKGIHSSDSALDTGQLTDGSSSSSSSSNMDNASGSGSSNVVLLASSGGKGSASATESTQHHLANVRQRISALLDDAFAIAGAQRIASGLRSQKIEPEVDDGHHKYTNLKTPYSKHHEMEALSGSEDRHAKHGISTATEPEYPLYGALTDDGKLEVLPKEVWPFSATGNNLKLNERLSRSTENIESRIESGRTFRQTLRARSAKFRRSTSMDALDSSGKNDEHDSKISRQTFNGTAKSSRMNPAAVDQYDEIDVVSAMKSTEPVEAIIQAIKDELRKFKATLPGASQNESVA